MSPRKVHVVVLADCTAMVSVGIVEILRKSLLLAAGMARGGQRLSVSLVSATGDRVVTTAGGLKITCDSRLREVASSGLVIVPSLDPEIGAHLAQNAAVVPWLRALYRRGADVASVCTGAFLLAEAGLLDGKTAATHWAFEEALRARYPKVAVESRAIVVDQGRVLTAGGATAFLNLALYLVERELGAEVARASERMFLVDVNKSPQSAYAMFAPQKAHGDDDILRAQRIIERDLAEELTVDRLAGAVAMSRRNFVRRFKLATGNTPRDYLQRVRVEAAKRMLETSARSIAEVARSVGYEDVVAFRRLFVRWTGLTQADYRARYGRAGSRARASTRGMVGRSSGRRRVRVRVRVAG